MSAFVTVTGISSNWPGGAAEPSGEVVLFEGRRLVQPSISRRRLGSFLRQHGHDEFLNSVVSSINLLRFHIRRDLRFTHVYCPEAQPLYVSETIYRVGPLFHLLALRVYQRPRSHLKPVQIREYVARVCNFPASKEHQI